MTEPNTDPGKPEAAPKPASQEGKPPQEGEPQDPEGKPAQGGDEVAKLRQEAAKYRTRLRQAEGERDKLASRLADHDRAEVERQVSGDTGGLQNPADFWLAGVSLDDLRDDDGALDPAKIKAAKQRVLSEHPHWRTPAPNFDGGARASEPDKAPSFGEAVKKAAG